MSAFSDMTWTGQANIEDKFFISFSESSAIGSVIGRDNIDTVPHGNGNPDDHPTLNKVKRAGANYILGRGTINLCFDWEGDNDPPNSNDVDAFIEHLQSRNYSMSVNNIVKTDTNITFDLSSDMSQTGGPYDIFDWAIKANCAKVTVKDSDTYLACILRLGDTPLDWSFNDYIIGAGDTLDISKQGTECYLFICGSSFIIGDNTLADKSLKKLTSSSVLIRNTGSQAAKIGMIYK
jgi:hypothetical protein